METGDLIYFYRENDLFGWGSNFYKCNFIDEDGNKFNCSEQYFMFNKAKTFEPDNIKLLEKILCESSPTKIKKYGRLVKNYDEKIWNEKRFNIMVNGLRLKFGQNFDIKKELLNTKNKALYEASKTDKIWGIGFDASEAVNKDKNLYGQNLLGKALQIVRTEFN